jgi:drug/metabolite transporter (DMT)-like permease
VELYFFPPTSRVPTHTRRRDPLQKTKRMNERIGVLAAVLSSTLGGMAAATTRFVVGAVDPVTIATFRFGLGFIILVPIALCLRSRWPSGWDWIWTALLGLMFFAFFAIVYNVALAHTTAARGSLALSTLPLLTMLVAALFGAEQLTPRKTVGVLIAMAGVAIALVTGVADAPVGAWRGDLLMLAGTLCMAFYNVWSRPLIARSSPLGFVTASMGIGAVCLVAMSGATDGFAVVGHFTASRWIAVAYLGLFGGALGVYLWVFALERTTPTRVASTITVNPVAASLLAAVLIGESIGLNLVVGIAAVFAGVWIAMPPDPPMSDIVG